MPTWVHGLLQFVIVRLLKEAGFYAAAEIELRIHPDAHPRPDVIAKIKPRGAYPTEPADIVVKIVSVEKSAAVQSTKLFSRYSWRSASHGSMFAARRAGIKPAIKAMSNNKTPATL